MSVAGLKDSVLDKKGDIDWEGGNFGRVRCEQINRLCVERHC